MFGSGSVPVYPRFGDVQDPVDDVIRGGAVIDVAETGSSADAGGAGDEGVSGGGSGGSGGTGDLAVNATEPAGGESTHDFVIRETPMVHISLVDSLALFYDNIANLGYIWSAVRGRYLSEREEDFTANYPRYVDNINRLGNIITATEQTGTFEAIQLRSDVINLHMGNPLLIIEARLTDDRNMHVTIGAIELSIRLPEDRTEDAPAAETPAPEVADPTLEGEYEFNFDDGEEPDGDGQNCYFWSAIAFGVFSIAALVGALAYCGDDCFDG